MNSPDYTNLPMDRIWEIQSFSLRPQFIPEK